MKNILYLLMNLNITNISINGMRNLLQYYLIYAIFTLSNEENLDRKSINFYEASGKIYYFISGKQDKEIHVLFLICEYLFFSNAASCITDFYYNKFF